MQLLALSKFIQYRGPLVARVVGRRLCCIAGLRLSTTGTSCCIGVGMIDADAHLRRSRRDDGCPTVRCQKKGRQCASRGCSGSLDSDNIDIIDDWRGCSYSTRPARTCLLSPVRTQGLWQNLQVSAVGFTMFIFTRRTPKRTRPWKPTRFRLVCCPFPSALNHGLRAPPCVFP